MSARILIADDEDSLRWVLEKGLTQAGYQVTAVQDGEAAVRAFEAEPFDLVFLDVKMPGMDGLEALQRIKAVSETLPVVIISGHGNVETAVRATKLGAFDFIEKPLEREP